MKKVLILTALAAISLTCYGQVKKTKAMTPVQPTVKPADKKTGSSKALSNAPKNQTPGNTLRKQPAKGFLIGGQNLLNAGIGLGTFYRGLPLGASFEHGFSDDISAGLFADYSSYNYGRYYGSGDKLTIIYTGLRGSYHFGRLLKLEMDQLDLYGGASLGYHHVSYSFENNGYYGNPYDNGVFFGLHVGGRYLLSGHIGVFAELGYGVAALKVGVTLKF